MADAASGFTRASVALYAYVPADQDPEPVLAALLSYAHARDWDTPCVLIDREPGYPGWAEALASVAAGRVQGIVTKVGTVDDIHDRDLDEWLSNHDAFLSEMGEAVSCLP